MSRCKESHTDMVEEEELFLKGNLEDEIKLFLENNSIVDLLKVIADVIETEE